MLNKRIYKSKLQKALDSMPDGKSPGNDELTVKFLNSFWKINGEPLFRCVKESIEEGEMSTSMKRYIIRLNEKKGKDPLRVANWRKISLINKSQKYITKALARRMDMDHISYSKNN